MGSTLPICWGSNDDHWNGIASQASAPEGERFASISSGGSHTCALREDGTPICWGSNNTPYGRYSGQSLPPEGERFASISSGGSHTCALREDGTPVCWGSDGEGQSSPNDRSSQDKPFPLEDEQSSHSVVRIEFPAWVEESPGMAQSLATSDVIAKAKFVSLDVAVNSHDSWGHVAELVYTFEAVRYLKGNGDDELVVRMSSGPKYIAFPDWLDNRTQSEAIELADNWLSRSIDIFDNR